MRDFCLRTHNGYVTAFNPKTNQHRTFQVRTQPDDSKFAPGRRVVSLLVGPDNTHSYKGFGFVEDDGTIYVWKRLQGTEFERLADVLVRADQYERLGVEFNVEGHCRRCNRLLTTPESVASGIGPVCAGR